ncbi:hypothetical protein tb265_03470 [Gemmatimonadetes bacterium T265]|nr:hypothetical protein tb265_03470 [Gemmatimonadetes bacterium T265]
MDEPGPEAPAGPGAPRRRVLIDHCVPRPLMRLLAGEPAAFDVERVGEAGRRGRERLELGRLGRAEHAAAGLREDGGDLALGGRA